MRSLLELGTGERGISKVVGVTLMVAIVVVLVAVAAAFLVGFGEETDEEPDLVSMESDVVDGELVVSHTGGESIDPGDLLVKVANGTEQLDIDGATGTDADQFTSGSNWNASVPIDGEVTIQVIYEPTNSILYEDELEDVDASDDSDDGSSGGGGGTPTGPPISGTVSVNPPIQGAIVTAYNGTEQLGQVTTDSNGEYNITEDEISDISAVSHLSVSVEGGVDVDGNTLYAGARRTVSGEGTFNFTFSDSADATPMVDGTSISVVYGAQEGDADDNPIANVEMLQAMSSDLTADYELVRDIDASETENWNGGSGFDPVGGSTDFGGTFDGNGHVIGELVIDRSEESVGLFGSSNGAITNVGLEGVTIDGGDSYVAGLVGQTFSSSTVSESYVTGSVSGTGEYAGGLVGWNNGGDVSDSYATADVSGIQKIGGLVGANDGTVSTSYATGFVTGTSAVGGLVGENLGAVSNSYWDTESSGQTDSSGGTGLTTSEMQGEAATDSMEELDYSNTWAAVQEDYPELQAVG